MSELRNPPESDDFEWVNAWANGASPATDDEPKQEPVLNAAAGLAERPAPQETIAQHPTDVVAPKPPVTAQPNTAGGVMPVPRKRGPDAGHFVHPATRRFFAALRAPASASPGPAPAATEERETGPVVAPVTAAPSQPVTVESTEASLAPDASQLERDIAEIECAREALLEPAPFTISDPRKPRGPFAALRHAESVPILVGSVVGATLLIVFGAAASLISLR